VPGMVVDAATRGSLSAAASTAHGVNVKSHASAVAAASDLALPPTITNKGTFEKTAPPSGVAVPASALVMRSSRGHAATGTMSFASTTVPRVSPAILEKQRPYAPLRLANGETDARGSASAPVTVIELGDYHSPDTRQLESTLRDLTATDTTRAHVGRARLYWKDADRGDGDDYLLAARAARAAGEQSAFWDMHDRIMKDTKPLTPARVVQLARHLPIDQDAFAASLRSEGLTSAIDSETSRAGTIPVLATPSFVVNGRIVEGGTAAAATLRAAVEDAGGLPRVRGVGAGSNIAGTATPDGQALSRKLERALAGHKRTSAPH